MLIFLWASLSNLYIFTCMVTISYWFLWFCLSATLHVEILFPIIVCWFGSTSSCLWEKFLSHIHPSVCVNYVLQIWTKILNAGLNIMTLVSVLEYVFWMYIHHCIHAIIKFHVETLVIFWWPQKDIVAWSKKAIWCIGCWVLQLQQEHYADGMHVASTNQCNQFCFD